MDELAVELGRDPMELRQQNWIKHEEFPFTTVCGLTYDSGNYEQATAAGDGAVRLRGPAPRAGGAAALGRPGAAGHRHLDVHRDVRARPVAGCSARWPTARAAGRPRASGCSPPARSRSSPAPRRTVRGTRRRSARSSPTSSACRSRTSRSCTATPRSRRRASTPTDRARSPSAASRSSRPAQKVIAKASKLAAHLLEASEDDIEFANGTVHGAGHRQGQAHPGDRVRRVHGARLPGRHGALARRRRRVRPGQLLVPARHAPRGDRGRHRDRARRRCASTSAWTTSATWSTRSSSRARCTAASPRASRRPCSRRPTTTSRARWSTARSSTTRCPRPPTCRASTPTRGRARRPRANPLGRQGRRRGRHDRLHPGDRQRRDRRACATSASPTSRCRARRSVCGGPSRTAQGPLHAGDAGRHPLAGRRPRLDRPEQPPGRGPVIPAQFDYVKPSSVDEARRGAAGGRRRRQDPRRRAEPAPGAAAAARGAVRC